jgi:hypothetical protein
MLPPKPPIGGWAPAPPLPLVPPAPGENEQPPNTAATNTLTRTLIIFSVTSFVDCCALRRRAAGHEKIGQQNARAREIETRRAPAATWARSPSARCAFGQALTANRSVNRGGAARFS